MAKVKIPEWLKFTDVKAVIEGDGYQICFASMQDAAKAYTWAVESYGERRKAIDFEKPRRVRHYEKITFVAVEQQKEQVHIKPIG